MSSTDLVTFPGRGGTGAESGRPGVGRAHGKAILLGEHAVVYGAPALVMPMPQLTVTVHATRFACPGDGADKISFAIAGQHPAPVTPLVTDGLRYLVEKFRERAAVAGRMCADVLIDSGIPQGRGLGSSAACARAAVLALADAFGRPLDAAAVYDLVQASETVAHGRASGIDALATGATAPLLFRGGSARELPITMSGGPSRFDGVFIVADSGAGGSTKEAVELLRDRFEQDEKIKEAFVRRVSELTTAALRDLDDGRLTGFGARLTENHRLLRDLGISTEPIDAMVEAALAAGGLGAKITGGGLGGCMIALAGDPGQAEAVAHGIEAAGAVRTWVVPVGRFASHDR
ncbi:mevalonate kinase [Actinoplanes hulinensis]|uniref:mevalonate kinase n=1 Tax=Actinoplanes hulinensis TaxID=1144547 RepID=A0ABS7B1D4_9ACTN|nr:mevalonate kinase [Actinoplanes hulinensis]MBW6434864.1 mevalonate kinase [Actinoplanes hulinensis]